MRARRLLPLLWVLALPACFPRAAREEEPLPRGTARGPGRGEVVGEGLASYYGAELQGRRTASGELFDRHAFTAAHRTLRFGTCLEVVNLENGRTVRVRVNDRGPFAAKRVLDLSEAAAKRLGMVGAGVARVRMLRCG